MNTALAEEIPRNRKQRTEVEVTREEAAVFRPLAKVSRMSIIRLSSLKGSAIQREEQANSIKIRGSFMEERQVRCSRLTSSTVIWRDTAPVTTVYKALLWEMIQTDPVKETAGGLGKVVT